MKIGIIDIGSNTIVCEIYEENSQTQKLLYHDSTYARLVQYNVNQHFTQEGIQKGFEVLQKYKTILDQNGVSVVLCFSTEPIRHIDNLEEVLASWRQSGLEIRALSGEEEAMFDFYGSQLDVPKETGIAFDIGGGSTEFIAFENHQILEAISIPYGCVRLAQLPLTKETAQDLVSQTLQAHPLLQSVSSPTIIGIGGTAKAARSFHKAYYWKKEEIPFEELHFLYEKLMAKDTQFEELKNTSIDKGRRDVFLPGFNMMISIMEAFHASSLKVSSGGIRNGILHQYKKSLGE